MNATERACAYLVGLGLFGLTLGLSAPVLGWHAHRIWLAVRAR